MAISNQVRRLSTKWETGNGWPKRLEWLEIKGIRGWTEQRIKFDYPIVAIVGENGSGKSTILQSAACSYVDSDRPYYPTEFFPETAWDTLSDVRITAGVLQGQQHITHSIRKPTTRWLGQPERPERRIEYIDLSRLQPVGTRVGYARIAKNRHIENSATDFSTEQLQRLSGIMGRDYDHAKMALSDIDDRREIPVLTKSNQPYSGFHQGSGETTIAELLKAHLPQYGLVLIDEIESSLHPRAQRRLVRDLAQVARDRECQIILSTHSPYVLDELPLNARIYILESLGGKEIVSGVSPEFAMTKMDDERYPEVELYVEDNRSATLLSEILSKHAQEIFLRCEIIPFGAANLGVALGQMVAANRFPRPTRVYLDGDQGEAIGCILLPGNDAPERVVFERLRQNNWRELWTRIARDIAAVSDACVSAMRLGNHHEWVNAAATELRCGGEVLWQAMCSEWAQSVTIDEVRYLIQEVEDALD